MKRAGLLLAAVILLTIMATAHLAYSDDTGIADLKKDIQKILERQDEILRQIEDLRADINIVKIRTSG